MSSNGWKRYKFSDFVSINPTISLKGINEFSFIEMKDLSEGKRYVRPSAEKQITGGARFKTGDTLFARITPCLENGKIGQAINLKNGVGFGSTEFLVFSAIPDISDKDFIYYLSCWQEVRKFAEQNMVGTSGRQRVSKDAFEKLSLVLPDIHIQQRIAYVLSALDDKIENNIAANETLIEIAQTLFKEWFVDFNYPGADGKLKESDFGPIPQNWDVNQIGEICYVQNGYAFKSNDFQEKGEVGIIKIKNINGNVVNIENTDHVDISVISSLDEKFKIKSGSLLIAMTGAEVGKIGLVPLTEKNLWLNQRVGMFKEKTAYGNLYMYLLLSTNTYQTAIQNSAVGSAQPNISASAIESIRAIIPSVETIGAFGRIMQPIFEKMLDNLAENETLKNTRDSLLPKLMSGEIEVNG